MRSLAALSLMLLVALPCQAQFKTVGPDGKVTYTDRPPVAGEAARPVAVHDAATPVAELPYALRQVVARYPVTLYTTPKCAPCDAGRNWLRTRGVPFDEKSVASKEENELLIRTVGGGDLPSMTIGSQAVRGFSPEQWTALFDAAGYPQASQLPRTYRYAAATPLIGRPAVAETQPPAAETPPAAVPSGPTPDNPAGIKF